MIRVENLTKSFAGNILFEKTGFNVSPRERIGLVGRNGHGKTTLLRMLAGFETPDAGSILIDGREISVSGNAWLDREWSTSALSPGVVQHGLEILGE